jgi:hypothetical protein
VTYKKNGKAIERKASRKPNKDKDSCEVYDISKVMPSKVTVSFADRCHLSVGLDVSVVLLGTVIKSFIMQVGFTEV